VTITRTFALAASAMAFFAISGAAYAGTVSRKKHTVSLKKHQEMEHRKLLIQAPTQISGAFDYSASQATGYNTHRYHGGPKSSD
jgi:hypothetical protein